MQEITKEYIASLLPAEPALIEIGSFDGKDAQELLDATDAKEIYCFEPINENIEKIKALKDDRIILFPYAASCFNGKILMAIPSSHPQSATLKEPKEHLKVWPEIEYNNTQMVNATTLDSWNAKVRNGALIDFIWCDVNGSEADLIMGAVKTLAITKYLYIEYCEKELFKKALNRKKLIKALPGFEVIGDYNFKGNYGNLLFKNKNEKLWIQ